MRKVGTTKKSNIKCEHCKHYTLEDNFTYPFSVYYGGFCSIDNSSKNYWNRCKCFEWAERIMEQKNEIKDN